jgi:hypothetical protein
MPPPSEKVLPVAHHSGLEVDFDTNNTKLYSAILQCRWDDALKAVKENPDEAKTWVVRRYEDEEASLGDTQEIMWRFLPIHGACARQPPVSVIDALLQAYPYGASCVDDQGMFALHYASGNKASFEVIRALLRAFEGASKVADPIGMVPLHFMASWGPTTLDALDLLLTANPSAIDAQDEDGRKPIDLAIEGEYGERDAVIAMLNEWRRKSQTLTLEMPDEEEKHEDHMIFSVVSPLSIKRWTPLKQQHSIRQFTNHGSRKDGLHNIRPLTSNATEGVQDITQLPMYLHSKAHELEDIRHELRIKDALLQSAVAEREGLRKTLMEFKEEAARYKEEAELLADRCDFLTANLSTLMSQKEVEVDAMNQREDQWARLAQKRREKLNELIAMEDEMEAIMKLDLLEK